MRRLLVCILLLALICGLTVSASADSAAKSVSSYITVASDGSSQVTLTVTVHLDQPEAKLWFPLPGTSENVMLNGTYPYSRLENNLRYVDISSVIGNIAGDFTLTFTYTLPNCIATNKAGLLELRLPLLAGFAYPVQAMELTVTLPGPISAKPAFSSGYHQANIEKDLYCTVSGATVICIAQTELKDHETLSMTLTVPEEMLPQPTLITPDFQTANLLLVLFAFLALAYWLIFLRNLPHWPTSRSLPPDGYNAGELSSLLHLQGIQLHLMIFSWAQLGYLIIRLDPNGRVTLYRQMDMGNERSAFEQRCFKQLFGRRGLVDTGSSRYAELVRLVKRSKPNMMPLMHPHSGNLFVFRFLAAAAGAFCGVSIGIGLSADAASPLLWAVILGMLAMCSGWYIQGWVLCVFSPEKRKLWLIALLCAGWLALGSLASALGSGFVLVLGQLLAGLLFAFGGRRTPAGKQTVNEVLGLRKYLKTIPHEQLRAICAANPEYFHRMLPYALALGVDGAFVKRFHKLPIAPCPYLSIGTSATMPAAQWRSVMRRITAAMSARQAHSLQEKLADFLGQFMK